jgi:hypothetical protein
LGYEDLKLCSYELRCLLLVSNAVMHDQAHTVHFPDSAKAMEEIRGLSSTSGDHVFVSVFRFMEESQQILDDFHHSSRARGEGKFLLIFI